MPLPRAIINLEESSTNINALIYGDGDAGKTTLAGQLPDSLILATEDGTVSAARSGTAAKNVKVWNIEKWNDLEEAYNYLKNDKHPFKWVTIDSASSMMELLLRDLLDKGHAWKPSKSLDTPELQDYPEWRNKFKRFIDAYRKLPINVLFTAGSIDWPDKNGDPVYYPELPGKNGLMSKWIVRQPNIVAYYGKAPAKGSGEIIRRLVFEQILPKPEDDKAGIFAKNRYKGVFPKFLDMSIGDTQIHSLAEIMGWIEDAPEEVRRDADAPSPSMDEEDEISAEEEVPTSEPEEQEKPKSKRFRASTDENDEE